MIEKTRPEDRELFPFQLILRRASSPKTAACEKSGTALPARMFKVENSLPFKEWLEGGCVCDRVNTCSAKKGMNKGFLLFAQVADIAVFAIEILGWQIGFSGFFGFADVYPIHASEKKPQHDERARRLA